MENEVILTKEMFIDIMTAIRDMYNAGSDFYDKISDLIGAYPEKVADILFPDKIIDVMSDIMDDQEGWLGWYVYENDWGENELEGIDKDGNVILLMTLEDLWELIQGNKNK